MYAFKVTRLMEKMMQATWRLGLKVTAEHAFWPSSPPISPQYRIQYGYNCMSASDPQCIHWLS